MNVLAIQTALKSAGFDPGNLDGVWGRRTISAVEAFQKAHNLDVDGVVGPQTSGVLFAGAGATASILDVPPWYSIALRKMGLNEVRDKAALMFFLKSDGNALGDPSKLPWCGDFVETCVALALPKEPMVDNPYYALNWLRFGKPLGKNDFYRGAVAVFQRDGGGHVAFVAGHDATTVHTLGGNQSNSVSISKVAKARLVGLRWPATYPFPTGNPLPETSFDGTITTNEA